MDRSQNERVRTVLSNRPKQQLMLFTMRLLCNSNVSKSHLERTSHLYQKRAVPSKNTSVFSRIKLITFLFVYGDYISF